LAVGIVNYKEIFEALNRKEEKCVKLVDAHRVRNAVRQLRMEFVPDVICPWKNASVAFPKSKVRYLNRK
jgi:hypothetical protein